MTAPRARIEAVRQQGDPPPAPPEQPRTLLGVFFAGCDVSQILQQAQVVRALGFEPEIRLSSADTIELYTADVPAIIATLRASLDAKKPF